MSSRQLRKLQKQRELEAALENTTKDSDESTESDQEPTPSLRPKPNLFAALGGQDEDVDSDEADDDEAKPVNEPIMSEAKTITSVKKSRKKKKKGKKTVAAALTTTTDGDKNGIRDDEDEIDKAIKALNLDSAGRGTSVVHDEERQRRVAASNSLLQINSHQLKVINEMRSLFGREVIESANAEEEQQNQQQQNRRRRRRQIPQQVDLESFLRTQDPNAKKLPEVSLRRNIFIQGRDYWPAQSAGGLTMKEMSKAKDGSWTEYAYVHEGEYDDLQVLFFACVQLGDPMRMVHLLKRVPYHVSTLLQVSFVAKQDQNMALSSELCERALFTFGRVTTSAFRRNVEQGKARLDFRRPENRQFWLAGYHYLRSLLRKGTFRTALEWAKLMYALDPKDPYAMRHYLHFLAVRAYEPKWLLDFLQSGQENLDKQEEFDLETFGTLQSFAPEHQDWKYIKQSGILARLQLGDMEKARQNLKEGIQQVPWLYCALFQELGLDAPPSVWGVHAESGPRQFWVKLYLHFAKDLWNNAEATRLLTEVAQGMNKATGADLCEEDREADLGATRLAYLEGQTGLITLAPRELLDRQPNYEFDPLPPAEEDNIFTHEGTRLPWTARDSGMVRGSVANDTQVDEALARMQNILAVQGADGAVQGFGVAGPGEESDYDDETDEELRQDLEEAARRSREPGFIGQLLQMLGVGTVTSRVEDGVVEDGGDGYYDDDDDVDVPGGWLEEEENR